MSLTPQTSAGRVFPPVTPDLYAPTVGEPSSHVPDAARRLLGLADKELTFKQKYFGRDLDAESRAARLLGFHKSAMSFELAGEFPRADYFWRRFHEEVEEFAGDDGFREELWRVVGGGRDDTPRPAPTLRGLFVEVFAETHLAFYRGYARGDKELTPDSRAFVHFDHVKRLLPRMGVNGDALVDLLRGPFEAQLNALVRAGRWDDATRLCQLILKYAPGNDECYEELARIHFTRSVAALTNDSGVSAARADAENLAGAIRQLEAMRASRPYDVAVYEFLARLYQLRSGRLAACGRLSDALVAAQKAVLLSPAAEEVNANMNALIELMKSTQTKMREFEEAKAKQPNAQLNAWGQFLQAEAAKGFGPFNEYAQSAEAQATVKASLVARARELWGEIDLPVPAENQDERASALLKAVEGALADADAGGGDVVASWRKTAAGNPELAGIDELKVCAYLLRSRFGEVEDGREPEPPAHADDAPAMPVRGRATSRRGEPFDYWLFSRRDTGAKVWAALAVLLLFFVGAVWAREAWARSTRDAAFNRVIEAADRRLYSDVIDGAESFLSHEPWGASDGRRARVINYYKEALARFVIQQGGAERGPDVATRLGRYRQLVAGER